jgi:cell division protein FtsB
MAAFAAQGGEYGATDLLTLERRRDAERDLMARLRHEVDSLARLERALRTDSASQERAARELYGMLRPGEILYQVVPSDTAPRP